MKLLISLALLFTAILCSHTFASTYVGQTSGSFRVDESGSADYVLMVSA